MATARLEKVQEFLTCTICTDMYTDPCTLYCQHTFCRKCVTEYTKTKPEALQSNSIPCPSCRQVTKVPDPTRPVEEWAWQIKPSIIILGLIDTSQHDNTTGDTGRLCNICHHLGETTRATSWCPDCEVALCDRCWKSHRANPASRDHNVVQLSPEVKVRRRRKVMCSEHEKNCIEFHCKDCKKSACQKCCIIYHRACKSVLDIESMTQGMTRDMLKKQGIMSRNMKRKSVTVTRKQTVIKESSQRKRKIESEIQSICQRAIDHVKKKETQLLDQLYEVTETLMKQLKADVKTEEIEIQMYRQHCEFIDQAVNSECVMDMYDLYQACESGSLVLGDVRDTDITDSGRMNIKFRHDVDKVQHALDDLQLGTIEVTSDDGPMSSPVLYDITDVKTENDKMNSDTSDVTVLVVDGVQTVVVSDFSNTCLKSFYKRSNKSCHSNLPLEKPPRGITQLKENQVMVAVPECRQIVTVNVTPDLVLLSTIKTRKKYHALAVISPSSLAAGCWYPDCSVDILNMSGKVMKSVSKYNSVILFSTPWSLCVSSQGNIFASDYMKTSVTCLTSSGDVLWRQVFGESAGITTNGTDILLAVRDSNKVIQLSETGQFVRDVLTSADGLSDPQGIFLDTHGGLFVCDGTLVKEYLLQ